MTRVYLLSLITVTLAASADEAAYLPWGAPDLQGTWTNATITGLERWDGVDALVLSEAQASMLERADADFSAQIDNLPDTLPTGDMVGGYNSAWLDRGTRLLRVRAEPRTSIIIEPKNGKIPYTLQGWVKLWWGLINAQKHNNPEEMLTGDRCVVGYGSTGGPPMLPVLYNNNYQIVQTPDKVAIVVEMNHAVRTIRINDEPLPRSIRRWHGDSIGHYEGNSLVVRTTGFHPQQSVRGAIKHQLYVGKDSVVTERFTRTSPTEILYEFTVEDDEVYRQPWKGELVLTPSNGPIYEYACHEGNYGIVNILTAARQSSLNGLPWLLDLALNMPEEVSHPQLSAQRFDALLRSMQD